MNANDINGLQQMDDAEYGDEEGMPAAGGMQISNALAEQRATKSGPRTTSNSWPTVSHFSSSKRKR